MQQVDPVFLLACDLACVPQQVQEALCVTKRMSFSWRSYVCSHSLAANSLTTSDHSYEQTSLCALCALRWTLQLAAVQALLDEMGAEQGCLAVNQDGQCIIGRQEAFYIYTPDGRGPCFVFEGGLENGQAARSFAQQVLCKSAGKGGPAGQAVP